MKKTTHSIALTAVVLVAAVSCKPTEKTDNKATSLISGSHAASETFDPLASLDEIEVPKVRKISIPTETIDLIAPEIRTAKLPSPDYDS